ncbi:MAG: discoidin domain-containing protein [Thermomicrobiales bacterium]
MTTGRSWRDRSGIRFVAGVVMLMALAWMLFARSGGEAFAQPVATPDASPGGSCIVAAEPNDQVADAVDLGSGAVCATAANPTGGQDIYRWTVDPADATSTWTITSTDIAGQASRIEVYSVTQDEAGTVTQATKLVSVDGGSGANAGLRDLIWQPGTYYVGVASSGPGPYTLTIEKGTPLPPQNDPDGHDTAQTAVAVSGAFALSGDRTGSDDFYAWTLDQGQATHHWSLALQGGVATTVYLSVTNADGNVVMSGNGGPGGQVTLPDLGLPAGTYTIRVQSQTDGPAVYRLAAVEGSLRDGGHEDEPNDVTPMPLVLTGDSTTLVGRLSTVGDGTDRDTYSITIDADQAGHYLDVRGIWPNSPSRKLCLQDANGQELRCVEGDAGAALSDLALTAGTYRLVVTGNPDDTHPYMLKLVFKGSVEPGFESEPNESIANASALVASGKEFTGSGRLSTNDRDTFVMEVSGEPQLWTIEVTGDGVSSVALLDASGGSTMVRSAVSGEPVTRIFDAFLAPGKHWVQVQGASGDYQVRMIPEGPPDPAGEHEPNDAILQSQPIALEEVRNGRVPDTTDVDIYRFSLQNQTYVRIEVESPADAQLWLNVNAAQVEIPDLSAQTTGQSLVYDLMLPMGDYSLGIRATVPSMQKYFLRISILDPAQVPDDLEPNGSAALARAMPADLRVDGLLDPGISGTDSDWYRLPDSLLGKHVSYVVSPGVSASLVTVGADGVSQNPVASNPGDVDGAWTADLPTEGPVYLVLVGSGPYRAALATGDATPEAEIALGSPEAQASPVVALASPVASPMTSPVASGASGDPVAVTISLPATAVAAYWQDGQRIDATVDLANTTGSAVTVRLGAALGNVTWTADMPADAVTIQPGASVQVPVTIHVAPDAWAEQPVYVSIAAMRDDGTIVGSALALVTPRTDTAPVNAEAHPPLPGALLGGLDAAWTGLGAQPSPAVDQDPTVVAQLFDGFVNSGTGWNSSTSVLPQEITVQLAGDQPVPVVGFVLDPRGYDDIPPHQVAAFEIDLSPDGVTFTKAYAGTLSIAGMEQSFVLDAPVNSRFARLRILSAQDPTTSTVHLGEWKVIAQAGWQPAPTAGTPVPASGTGLDIAQFAVGGHIVDVQPPIGSTSVTRQMAMADGAVQTVSVPQGGTVTWITGFQDDRAALVTSLTWVDPVGSDPAARIDAVTVEVATDGATGPWTSMGTWTIDRAQATPTFAFPQPTWARFIRFTAAPAIPGGVATPEATQSVELPDMIHIYEVPGGTAVDGANGPYRSILGEWGEGQQPAIYEVLVPSVIPKTGPDAGNTADTATSLPLGTPVTDTVSIGSDEDWYAVTIPAGMTRLTLDLDGYPSVNVAVSVIDEAGKPVPLTAQDGDSATSRKLIANVEPGKTYRVQVVQLPTSVIFAFDTSLSIGAFAPVVVQGIDRYVTDVLPGREQVNILPFGGQLLLPDWSDQPWILQGAIAGYPGTATSSDAEGALLTSLDALGPVEGNRAIVIVTDAETSPTNEQLAKLWPGLMAQHPRIFTVHIQGGDDPAGSRNLMQDWSSAGDGTYVYARTQGEADVAFERATTELRRPALYTLTANVLAPEPTPTPTFTPTATPSPSPTMTPTATPSQTPTMTPTATPSPTLTPTATIASTPPPTQVPQPGAIQVEASPVGQQAPIAASADVAIIFDTSGSMLQDLNGQSRADVAKDALGRLVTETLPAGTTVSLRTFGDTPGSCETNLVVPPGPLDPVSMNAAIQGVPIVNEVRTPIGASLEAVLQDLTTDPGPKIVVIVTDGEETCGGDPAAAIAALAASGIDVRVNIVGFALDDASLKAQFADWARIGNGRYIDAGNQQELDAAIVDAVRPTFTVLDANGNVVASGQVGGDAVPVPAGTYRVVIASDPEQVFPRVEVKSGVTTKIIPQQSGSASPTTMGIVDLPQAGRTRVRRLHRNGRGHRAAA